MDNKKSHKFFHSYCTYPTVKFATQTQSEQVVLVVRAHPITQISWIFNALLFFAVIIILNFFLPLILNSSQIFFLNSFLIVFTLAYVWLNFLHWFFNVGIITNKRVVDIDFSDVIYKEVSEANLDKVEDVTSKNAGYFGSLFEYGNVFVQTAGTEVNIEFENIPKPSDVVKLINSLVNP